MGLTDMDFSYVECRTGNVNYGYKFTSGKFLDRNILTMLSSEQATLRQHLGVPGVNLKLYGDIVSWGHRVRAQ